MTLSDGCTANAYFECTYNGQAAACSALQTQNDRDLEHVLDFVEDDSPELLQRGGGVETINFSDEISANGDTAPFSGEIRLSRFYLSRAKLVDTVGHELAHRNDGVSGRMLTIIQDEFESHKPRSERNFYGGQKHQDAYKAGNEMRDRYLKSQ